MFLKELLRGVDFVANTDRIEPLLANINIGNICTALSAVKENSAFVALKGLTFDGHNLCGRAEEMCIRDRPETVFKGSRIQIWQKTRSLTMFPLCLLK